MPVAALESPPTTTASSTPAPSPSSSPTPSPASPSPAPSPKPTPAAFDLLEDEKTTTVPPKEETSGAKTFDLLEGKKPPEAFDLLEGNKPGESTSPYNAPNANENEQSLFPGGSSTARDDVLQRILTPTQGDQDKLTAITQQHAAEVNGIDQKVANKEISDQEAEKAYQGATQRMLEEGKSLQQDVRQRPLQYALGEITGDTARAIKAFGSAILPENASQSAKDLFNVINTNPLDLGAEAKGIAKFGEDIPGLVVPGAISGISRNVEQFFKEQYNSSQNAVNDLYQFRRGNIDQAELNRRQAINGIAQLPPQAHDEKTAADWWNTFDSSMGRDAFLDKHGVPFQEPGSQDPTVAQSASARSVASGIEQGPADAMNSLWWLRSLVAPLTGPKGILTPGQQTAMRENGAYAPSGRPFIGMNTEQLKSELLTRSAKERDELLRSQGQPQNIGKMFVPKGTPSGPELEKEGASINQQAIAGGAFLTDPINPLLMMMPGLQEAMGINSVLEPMVQKSLSLSGRLAKGISSVGEKAETAMDTAGAATGKFMQKKAPSLLGDLAAGTAASMGGGQDIGHLYGARQAGRFIGWLAQKPIQWSTENFLKTLGDVPGTIADVTRPVAEGLLSAADDIKNKTSTLATKTLWPRVFGTLGKEAFTGMGQMAPFAATSQTPEQFGSALAMGPILHMGLGAPDIAGRAAQEWFDSAFTRNPALYGGPTTATYRPYGTDPVADAATEAAMNRMSPQERAELLEARKFTEGSMEVHYHKDTDWVQRIAEAKSAGKIVPPDLNARGVFISSALPDAQPRVFIREGYWNDAATHEIAHPYFDHILSPKGKQAWTDLAFQNNDPNDFTRDYTKGGSDYDSLPESHQSVRAGVDTYSPGAPGMTKESIRNEMGAEALSGIFKGQSYDQLTKDPTLARRLKFSIGEILEKFGIDPLSPAAESILGFKPSFHTGAVLDKLIRLNHDLHLAPAEAPNRPAPSTGPTGGPGSTTQAPLSPRPSGESPTSASAPPVPGTTEQPPLSTRSSTEPPTSTSGPTAAAPSSGTPPTPTATTAKPGPNVNPTDVIKGLKGIGWSAEDAKKAAQTTAGDTWEEVLKNAVDNARDQKTAASGRQKSTPADIAKEGLMKQKGFTPEEAERHVPNDTTDAVAAIRNAVKAKAAEDAANPQPESKPETPAEKPKQESGTPEPPKKTTTEAPKQETPSTEAQPPPVIPTPPAAPIAPPPPSAAPAPQAPTNAAPSTPNVPQTPTNAATNTPVVPQNAPSVPPSEGTTPEKKQAPEEKKPVEKPQWDVNDQPSLKEPGVETTHGTAGVQKHLREQGKSPGEAQHEVHHAMRGEAGPPLAHHGPGNIGYFGYPGDYSWDHASLRGVGAGAHVQNPGSMIRGYSAGLTKEGALARGLHPGKNGSPSGEEFVAEDGKTYRWDDTAPTDSVVHGKPHHVPADYVDVYDNMHEPDPGVSQEQIDANKAYMAQFGITGNGERGAISPGQAAVEHATGVPAPPSAKEAPIIPKAEESEEKAPQAPTAQSIQETEDRIHAETVQGAKQSDEAYTASIQKQVMQQVGEQHAASLAQDDQRVKYIADAGILAGKYFDPTDPFHQWLLKGTTPQSQFVIKAMQDAIKDGRDLWIDYNSAPNKAKGTAKAEDRDKAQAESSGKERAKGLSPAQQAGKNMLPSYVGVSLGKDGEPNSLFYGGTSPDKISSNASQIVQRLGPESPYKAGPAGDPVAEEDMRGYLDNINNGWKGDGSAKLKRVKGVTLPQERPGFQPYTFGGDPEIAKAKADFWNLAVSGKGAGLSIDEMSDPETSAGRARALALENEGYVSGETKPPKGVARAIAQGRAQEIDAAQERRDAELENQSHKFDVLQSIQKHGGLPTPKRNKQLATSAGGMSYPKGEIEDLHSAWKALDKDSKAYLKKNYGVTSEKLFTAAADHPDKLNANVSQTSEVPFDDPADLIAAAKDALTEIGKHQMTEVKSSGVREGLTNPLHAKIEAETPGWTRATLHSGYERLLADNTVDILPSGEDASEQIHPGHEAIARALQEGGYPPSAIVKAGFMPSETPGETAAKAVEKSKPGMLAHASNPDILRPEERLKKNAQLRANLEKQQAKLDTSKPEEDKQWDETAKRIRDLENEHTQGTANLNRRGAMFMPDAKEADLRDLVAMHNTNEEGIQHAVKLGGFPVPSLAITKKSIPFNSFGDYTLIAHPDVVDPAQGAHVFDRDTYTKTQPQIKSTWDKKTSENIIEKEIKPASAKVDGKGSDSSNLYQFRDALDKRVYSIGDEAYHNDTARIAYLDSIGKLPKIEYEPLIRSNLSRMDGLDKATELLTPEEHEQLKHYDTSEHVLDKIRKQVGDTLRQKYADHVDEDFPEHTKEDLVNRATENLQWGNVTHYIEQKERGEQRMSPDTDQAIRTAVDANGGSKAVQRYLDNLFEPARKETYFEGARGKKMEYNLHNLTEAMSGGPIRATQKTMVEGLGKAAAKNAVKIGSFQEMHNRAEWMLTDPEKEKAYNNETQEHYFKALEPLPYDGSQWDKLDSGTKAIARYKKGPATTAGMQNALYREGFGKADGYALEAMKNVADRVHNAQTDYFEAKPQRAVRLNEFSAAVVPHDVKPETEQLLRDNGINTIEKYDRSQNNAPELRRQAVEKASELAKAQFMPARDEHESRRQEMFDSAAKIHGVTRRLDEAGYILPDGRLLDFSGRHESPNYHMTPSGQYVPNRGRDEFSGVRYTDHRNISWQGMPEGQEYNGMAHFVQEGAVRIGGREGAIHVGPEKLTGRQSDQIKYLADDHNGKVSVDVYGRDGNVAYGKLYDEGTKPVRIVNDIKRVQAQFMPSERKLKPGETTENAKHRDFDFGNEPFKLTGETQEEQKPKAVPPPEDNRQMSMFMPGEHIDPDRVTNKVKSDEIHWIPTSDLDNRWKTGHAAADFYLDKGGGKNQIGKRYQTAVERLSGNEKINAPQVAIWDDGTAHFIDGRHTFASMRDAGHAEVPVALSAESVDNSKATGLIRESPHAQFMPAKEVPQEHTSSETSINSTKVPAVFSKVPWQEGQKNIDIGGGKFDTATSYLSDKGVENHIYDPFNRSAEDNARAYRPDHYDTATVSNVLNVIKEPEARQAALQNAYDTLKPGGKAYISTYEGDGTGVARETKKGWQENRKTGDYLDEVRQVFPDAHLRNGVILAEKPAQVVPNLPKTRGPLPGSGPEESSSKPGSAAFMPGEDTVSTGAHGQDVRETTDYDKETSGDEMMRYREPQAHFMPFGGVKGKGFGQAEEDGRVRLNPYDNLPRYEISDHDLQWKRQKGSESTDTGWGSVGGEDGIHMEPGKPYKLSGIINHPELFKDYPQLKETRLFYDPGLDSEAKYASNDSGGNIALRHRYAKGALIHEIQHAIQDIEGNSRGSSPDAAAEHLRDIPTALDRNELIHQKYLENQGEIEAREASSRRYLTPEERQALPPYDPSKPGYIPPGKAWFMPETSKEEASAEEQHVPLNGHGPMDAYAGHVAYLPPDKMSPEERSRIIDTPDRVAKLAHAQMLARQWLEENKPTKMTAEYSKGALPKGKLDMKVEDLGDWIEGKNKKLDLNDPGVRTQMAKAVTYDLMKRLSQDGSGLDWYDAIPDAAVKYVADHLDPSINENRENRQVYRMALAVTSNGQNVYNNAETAYHAYQYWKDHGELPTDKKDFVGGGVKIKTMISTFKKMNDLRKDLGSEGLEDLLNKPMTVRQMKEYGLDVNGEAMDYKTHAALAMGPKIGSFYSALGKHFEHLVQDMWFKRTMNRMVGDMFGFSPAAFKSQAGELARSIRSGEVDIPAEQRSAILSEIDHVQNNEDLNRHDAIEWTPELQKWAADTFKEFGRPITDPDGTKRTFPVEKRTPVNMLSRAIHQNLHLTNDAPSQSERPLYREIMGKVLKNLKKTGIDMHMADAQALLWYIEQDLYKDAGAANKGSDTSDYLDGAHALVKQQQAHPGRPAPPVPLVPKLPKVPKRMPAMAAP